jgi:hypothetical protein
MLTIYSRAINKQFSLKDNSTKEMIKEKFSQIKNQEIK